jgi:predicted nucleic acid-binding protein
LSKGLATDANILLSAVFGSRTQAILDMFPGAAHLCAPATCFEEARRNAVFIARKRRADVAEMQLAIDNLTRTIEPVEMDILAPFEQAARPRIERRDPSDWPVIALALATGYPIWTEDQDFFGCGIATWTTDRVALYLQQA